MSEEVVVTDIPDRPELPVRSPLSPSRLFRLFFDSRTFFSSTRHLAKKPELLIVAWIAGMAYAIYRIDSIYIEVAQKGPSDLASLVDWLDDSWFNFWRIVALFSILGGLINWYVGSWWYRKRLEWSGAAHPDPRLARSVYLYQQLVQTLPTVLSVVVYTIMYEDFTDSWLGNHHTLSGLVLGFAFQSCRTGYIGATTAFQLERGKARAWFLIVPLIFYIVTIGVILAPLVFF